MPACSKRCRVCSLVCFWKQALRLAAKSWSEEAHRVLTWSWNGEGAWEWESRRARPGKRRKARRSLV